MNSDPTRKEKIDLNLMLRVIEDFRREYSIKTVVFAGGEPTLLKGALLAGIAKCRELNIVSRIVTNVSWAINEEKATSIFRSLYSAGLNEVNISCDDYHSPDIPFERVKTAWKAARKFKFGAVIIANAYDRNSKITPEFINKELGEDLPYRFDENGVDASSSGLFNDDGTIVGISNATLQRLGRGNLYFTEKDVIADHGQAVLNHPCPSAIRLPAITPNGSLAACCGFELDGNPVLDFGSLATHSVTNLVQKANDNILAKLIGLFGPGFLIKFIRKIDPELLPEKNYVGICEACQDVVTNRDALGILFENKTRLAAIIKTIDDHLASTGKGSSGIVDVGHAQPAFEASI